jgi:DNA-binding LacI/PurR family transcriptional regulator
LIAAHAASLKVPENLMLSAGTDSVGAQSGTPSMTALDLNPELMGQRACEMLISIIEKRQMLPGEIIPYKLIERDSVPTLAAAHANKLLTGER